MTVLLAKAASLALAQHLVVNACCKDEKNFSYNSSINLAIVVAIDGGLITPILQDADKLDIYLLSQKWKELVKKARSKQLQPDEYNSGAFTLSNLGMFGVDRFDAILPPGQGAIMAVGASKPTIVPGADSFFTIKNKMMVSSKSLFLKYMLSNTYSGRAQTPLVCDDDNSLPSLKGDSSIITCRVPCEWPLYLYIFMLAPAVCLIKEIKIKGLRLF
ncbi:hypothetical protein KSP39_PZI013431 [Platanthera zijinensis]|uniref:2-oxoacid dehydrogenase acyltransferase catalytic domain-containing protein n=1 Tax=Platanthera zijinensis TaxID=2320716 RepID=A0AAP0G3D1_9ASPA